MLFFSDSSQVGNYSLKRCYKLNVIVYYNIPGGLKSNTIAQMKTKFTASVGTLLANPDICQSVITTSGDIVTSPPRVDSVFFRIPVIFTASNRTAVDQVSSRLINCINQFKSYKGILDNNIPSITEAGRTYQKYNDSTITDKKSCCGGDIPPPCCAAGSVKVSGAKCGKV